jgi:hypothetical protein
MRPRARRNARGKATGETTAGEKACTSSRRNASGHQLAAAYSARHPVLPQRRSAAELRATSPGLNETCDRVLHRLAELARARNQRATIERLKKSVAEAVEAQEPELELTDA